MKQLYKNLMRKGQFFTKKSHMLLHGYTQVPIVPFQICLHYHAQNKEIQTNVKLQKHEKN